MCAGAYLVFEGEKVREQQQRRVKEMLWYQHLLPTRMTRNLTFMSN